MSIKVHCPGCRQKIRFTKAPDGRLGRCPRCNAVVLTMENDADADASFGPDASHGAVVPCQRRRTSPEDETVVFKPLFPPPVPAIPQPVAVATASRAALPLHRPARSRRRLLGVSRFAGGSFVPRGYVPPSFPVTAGSVAGDFASAGGLVLMVSLWMVGAAIIGLWIVNTLSALR